MTTLTKTEDAPAPTGPESFLSVRDLKVRFSTEDGIVKALAGVTTIEEVLRVTEDA